MNELETIQAAQIQRLEQALIKLIAFLSAWDIVPKELAEELGALLKGD